MRNLFYIVLILVTVGLLDWIYRADTIKLDGIQGEAWGLITRPDTRYSEGYTHGKFGQIEIGMTEQQVLEILGEPLVRWQPYLPTNFQNKRHYIGFQYSESPSSTNYRLRQVYLDRGKVAEIISYYYLD